MCISILFHPFSLWFLHLRSERRLHLGPTGSPKVTSLLGFERSPKCWRRGSAAWRPRRLRGLGRGITALHKHYTVDQWKAWAAGEGRHGGLKAVVAGAGKDILGYVAVSTGILEKDMDKLAQILKAARGPWASRVTVDGPNWMPWSLSAVGT